MTIQINAAARLQASEILAAPNEYKTKFPYLYRAIEDMMKPRLKKLKKGFNVIQMEGAVNDVFLLLKKSNRLGLKGIKDANSKLDVQTRGLTDSIVKDHIGPQQFAVLEEAIVYSIMHR